MTLISTFEIDYTNRTNLIETDITIPTIDQESFLISHLGLGNLVSSTSISAVDGSAITSIGSDSIYGTGKAHVAIVGDDGFGYAVNGFSGSDTGINGNGFISISGYGRIRYSPNGVLYFSLFPSSAGDVSGTLYINEHENGTLMQASSGSYGGFFVCSDSVIYFCSTVNQPKVGYFNQNSTTLLGGSEGFLKKITK